MQVDQYKPGLVIDVNSRSTPPFFLPCACVALRRNNVQRIQHGQIVVTAYDGERPVPVTVPFFAEVLHG